MRLRRLDIVGFKSFLDKTVVQFDDGVTGVVGPNGCGKSNIVDAIRWVLGEQSPKHLRGSAMQDVIFSGSQSRQPVNMTEVTLTFVNDIPDEIPARYREFAEIAVTRRLFRSGESEYLINKSSCRLMDITELFLGTGVGTKAYSIIEQGRIGLIVSAKPDDRRALIEEAAGITRYKSKRRMAERKMEHTRANLLRVGDVVSELSRRLESLKRQARKAERYKELKGLLRDIGLHIAGHRWLEMTVTRSFLERELGRLRSEIEGRGGEIQALEKDLRTRRDLLASEEARLANIQESAAQAEGRAKVHLERVSGLGKQ
ncbi:MAG: chromosome segregation SMC family protein, partial [Myxococcota bacterium]